MFNNAGISGNPDPRILAANYEDLKKVFDVNVFGAFLGAKHAARVMIPEKLAWLCKELEELPCNLSEHWVGSVTLWSPMEMPTVISCHDVCIFKENITIVKLNCSLLFHCEACHVCNFVKFCLLRSLVR
uniref:Putative zerumbone synthase-like n=1 Tax=Davidia involucrata TaxID=16924 RepID=A0A5B6YTA5_DAVIN